MRITKNAMIAATFGFALAISAPALAGSDRDEIGYAKDALGYEAILDGDYALALEQLAEQKRVARNDPARLINLGHAYAMLGRTGDASNAYRDAIDSPRHFELVLSDGTVIDSREAARRALAGLNNRMASR